MLINEEISAFLKTLKSDNVRIVENTDKEIQKSVKPSLVNIENNNINVGSENIENEKPLVYAVGVMRYADAQKIADSLSRDLVLIAPNGVPPVCRIMDYGKFRFEQKKREKELHKGQKQVEIKEIRLGLNIDDGDLMTKVNNAIKFLQHGDKVKIVLRFRGRELSHKNLGQVLISRFHELCAEAGTPEMTPKLEGRNLISMLAPMPSLNSAKQKTAKDSI